MFQLVIAIFMLVVVVLTLVYTLSLDKRAVEFVSNADIIRRAAIAITVARDITETPRN